MNRQNHLIETRLLNTVTRVHAFITDHSPPQIDGNDTDETRCQLTIEIGDNTFDENIALCMCINERGGEEETNFLPYERFELYWWCRFDVFVGEIAGQQLREIHLTSYFTLEHDLVHNNKISKVCPHFLTIS